MSGLINAIVGGLAGAGAGYGVGMAEVGEKQMQEEARQRDMQQQIDARRQDAQTNADLDVKKHEAIRNSDNTLAATERAAKLKEVQRIEDELAGQEAEQGPVDNTPRGMINRRAQAYMKAGYPYDAYKVKQAGGIDDKRENEAFKREIQMQMQQNKLDLGERALDIRERLGNAKASGGGGAGGAGDDLKGAKFDADNEGNRIIVYRNGHTKYPQDAAGNDLKFKVKSDQDEKFVRTIVAQGEKNRIAEPGEDTVARAKKLAEETSSKPKAAEDKFVVGKKYKDANGNVATYAGNGKWN